MSKQTELIFEPASRQAYRDSKLITAGDSTYKIEFEAVELGYNLRKDFEGIEDLAADILVNTQLDPVRGYLKKDGNVFVILDGGRRYRAIQLLRSQGHVIDYIKIHPFPSSMKPEDIIFYSLSSSINKSIYKPLEVAAAVAKLKKDYGLTNASIAERMGKSRQWVDNQIKIDELPDEKKAAIENGTLKVTNAIHEDVSHETIDDLPFGKGVNVGGISDDYDKEVIQAPSALLNKGDVIIQPNDDSDDEMKGILPPSKGQGRNDVDVKPLPVDESDIPVVDFDKARNDQEESINKISKNIMWFEGVFGRLKNHISDAEMKDIDTRLRWCFDECETLKFFFSKGKNRGI